MVISVINEALILLAAVYGGLLLGLFFDLYRLIRNIFSFGKIITLIGDVMFWVIALFVTLLIVYKSSSGLVRFYQLLGFVLGMMIYIKALSRHVMKLLYVMLRCARGLLYWVSRIGRGPFMMASNLLWRPYARARARVEKILWNMMGEAKKYIGMLRKKK